MEKLQTPLGYPSNGEASQPWEGRHTRGKHQREPVFNPVVSGAQLTCCGVGRKSLHGGDLDFLRAHYRHQATGEISMLGAQGEESA